MLSEMTVNESKTDLHFNGQRLKFNKNLKRKVKSEVNGGVYLLRKNIIK
jgi:hypothetical protein